MNSKPVNKILSRISLVSKGVQENSKAIDPVIQILDDLAKSPINPDDIPNLEEILRSAANRANSTVGIGKGGVHGTKVHLAFEKEVNGLMNPGLSTEVSYLRGKVVIRGTPGSVRVDVINGPIAAPVSAFDLKTGNAKLTLDRIRQLQQHIPGGVKVQ